ncbi:MAG: AAA family ATPase [Candidatus Solibacter sp.]
MRLLSLEVEHFRAIQSAKISFGPGLNVVHGPNDRGKSTLTEAIRAVLLVAPGSAEARSFATWGAAPGQFPKVAITFECDGATWRLEKIFAPGSRAKASLEKSTDGGTRYQPHAQGRDVEGKLRELLRWGLAAPGGRGVSQRTETFLTTALLGKQGEVSAIFEASFKSDQNESGRTLVTNALDALGQDPLVTKLLKRLIERTDKVYRADGGLKRSADSPIVQAQAELREREDRVRALEEAARKGAEIEAQIIHLLQARENALELRDQAHAHLEQLRIHQASAVKREQLDREVAQHLRESERTTAGINAIEAARAECLAAQADLALAEEQHIRAVNAAKVADDEALAARERLARARSLHQSSHELAASARDARMSDLRVQMEKTTARKTAAHAALAAAAEWKSLESQLAAAATTLDQAEQDVARSSAQLNLAIVWQEMQEARVLTGAVTSALSEHDVLTGRELAAATTVAEAEAALKAANAAFESARELDQQARSAGDERTMKLRLLDTRILHSEAAVRDQRQEVERARTALLQVGLSEKAQAAAAAADTIAAEIDASLARNATEIAQCEEELRLLAALALEVRRRTLASQVDELSAQESQARESRRRAVEMRDRATRLEAEAAGVRFPSAPQLASLQALQAAIQSRKSAGPGAPSRATALPLLAGVVAAAVGFAAARFAVSAGLAVSVTAALLLGVAVGVIVALRNARRQRSSDEASWGIETAKLESQLDAETAAVLREAGVAALEQVELRRQQCEELRTEAERSRQEAAGLDRQADSMLNSSAGLSSLRRDLATVVEQLALHADGALASQADPLTSSQEDFRDKNLRARERLEAARLTRSNLQTQQVRQVVVCASARAQADNALADLNKSLRPGVDPRAAVVEAESRLREAEAQLESLRQESKLLKDPLLAPAAEVSETAVSDARNQVAAAGLEWEDRRRERQLAADHLAHASARLDLARGAAEAIGLEDIELRLTAAQAAADPANDPSDRASASARHEQAKQRLSNASAAVDLLSARLPAARHKAEMLAPAFPLGATTELESAEQEERRIHAALSAAEGEGAAPNSDTAEELRDAELGAARAGQELTGTRTLAVAATARRDELRARAERARGDLEASGRQLLGMDVEAAEHALAKARQALADLPPAPEVTADQLLHAGQALENSEAELKACEGSLNEVRGKLDLVGGQVGIERLEEEREAVQRAREHAEDLELDYAATRHMRELLEAAEARRSSHLGRSLAAPVTERFRAMAGDLYAHVSLDPDLRMEGFDAIGGQHSVEELSVGTREQLATIIRLAIAAQLKTAVLLDDQLVHSDTGRIEWFRRQVRNSVRDHDHQVIVMTCRLSDYSVDDEVLGAGESLTLVNILDVVQRVKADGYR